MAKCIKMLDTGLPIRVPDAMAQELVAIGRAEYTNREEWKAGGRETKVPRTHYQQKVSFANLVWDAPHARGGTNG